MDLHDPDDYHDNAPCNTYAEDDRIKGLLLVSNKLADDSRNNKADRDRHGPVAYGYQNILHTALTAHKAGDGPVADRKQDVESHNSDQFVKRIHASGIKIVDNEARKEPVRRKARAEQEDHDKGYGHASAFLVSDPVISVNGMSQGVKKVTPLFFRKSFSHHQ